MRNNSLIADTLKSLGLSTDESSIYLSLLHGQKNHLDVSRETGIARSNVYRIVDGLIEKGIIHQVTTEEDKLLESADPRTLELLVIQQETAAQQKRNAFNQLLPMLIGLAKQDDTFVVKNYSGVEGLKQMLWNELSTKDEICIFSCGSLNPATGNAFAEKYRMELISRGIIQRAIENPESENPTVTSLPGYENHFLLRHISRDVLNIMPEITIHDDTVNIYNNFVNNTQLGTEIKNPFLANFMRQIFEHYWALATPFSVKHK